LTVGEGDSGASWGRRARSTRIAATVNTSAETTMSARTAPRTISSDTLTGSAHALEDSAEQGKQNGFDRLPVPCVHGQQRHALGKFEVGAQLT